MQPLRSLKYMNLSNSHNLEIFPNLLEATNLETLDLSWCVSLVELPSSIRNLQKLSKLEMSCCKRLEIIPTNINLASLSRLHFRYCPRLKTFPEISTNITFLKIKGTAITEVPPSVKHWRRIEEICMERTQVMRLVHVPYILDALCLRSNFKLKTIPNDLILLPRLRMIDISFCINIVSLPKLPDSVSALTALNCESLQRIHGPFRNPSISLKFTNCLKLDQRAQETIHQSVYRVTILPGGQVPSYFTHRDHGNSILIHSDSIDLLKFWSFKVCLVLEGGSIFDRCDTYFYKNMFGEPTEKYLTTMVSQPMLSMDHLCMFELVLPRKYDGPSTHLETRRKIPLMEFNFKCNYGCKVVECGIQFLEAPRSLVAKRGWNHFRMSNASKRLKVQV